MGNVTSVGSSYTASYDAAGDTLCRAPTSSTTCAGTQTGAQLSYDNEGCLLHWQNAPTIGGKAGARAGVELVYVVATSGREALLR